MYHVPRRAKNVVDYCPDDDDALMVVRVDSAAFALPQARIRSLVKGPSSTRRGEI
jgi:hypothetical protein